MGSHRQLRQPLAAFKVSVCLYLQVPKTTLRVHQQPASSGTQRRSAAARQTLQYQRLLQQLGVPSGGLVLPLRRQLRQRPSNSALDGGVKQHSAQRAAEITSFASTMRRQQKAAGGCYLTAALLLIALMCMLCCAQLAAAQPGSGTPGGAASGSSTGSGISRPTAAPKLCINNSECATWYPDMCQLTAATHTHIHIVPGSCSSVCDQHSWQTSLVWVSPHVRTWCSDAPGDLDASQTGRPQLQQRLPELRRWQQQAVHGGEHGHRRAALLPLQGPGAQLPTLHCVIE